MKFEPLPVSKRMHFAGAIVEKTFESTAIAEAAVFWVWIEPKQSASGDR